MAAIDIATTSIGFATLTPRADNKTPSVNNSPTFIPTASHRARRGSGVSSPVTSYFVTIAVAVTEPCTPPPSTNVTTALTAATSDRLSISTKGG